VEKVREIIIGDVAQIDREAYSVTIDPEMEDHGLCQVDLKTITLRLDKPKPMITTYVHEVLHGMDHEYHIGLTHKQVYQLEKAIYNFLEDNYLLPLEEYLEAVTDPPIPK